MKLTDAQFTAFTALGLMIMYEEQTLLQYMSEDDLEKLVQDVETFLCPLVQDGQDLVTPMVNVLRSAMLSAITERIAE